MFSLPSSPHFSSQPSPLPGLNQATKILPVSFLNRDGKPEAVGMPSVATMHEDDVRAFSAMTGNDADVGARPLPEPAAFERLLHALLETGQLFVTTDDGLSRVCFAGIGDPDHLYVEVLPRETAASNDHDDDIAGALCSLLQAEFILKRTYAGETTEKLSHRLNRLRRTPSRDAIAA